MRKQKITRQLGIAVFALILVQPSKAAPVDHHISLQSVSIHFKKSKERQAIHPGLGYEYSPYQSMGWQAGFFKDSFGYPSGYLGINYPVKKATVFGVPLRLIGVLNIVHKKFVKGGVGETKLVPFPIIETALRDNISLNLTGTPRLDYYDNKRTNGVLVMQLKIRWKQ